MAKRNIIVLGDRTTHGGTVVSAWGRDGPVPMSIDGKFVACVGDYVTCPMCSGTHQIIGGAENPPMELNGRRVATEGCLVSDGSKLISAGQSMAWHESDGTKAAATPPAAKGIQTASATSGISAEEARLLAQANKEKELDYGISLKRGGNRILTPLDIPGFDELPSGRTRNTELIDFEVANSRDPAESVSIEVLDGGSPIYSEPDTSRFLSPGRHHWQWDGYGADGVLDTRMLKSKTLTVRLTAAQGGKRQVRELKLDNHAGEIRWADARIDRSNKEIEITVRPNFTDGGTIGDPIPGYVAKTFEELKQMAKRGIEHYWTRDGSRPGGVGAPLDTGKGAFKVKVKADVNVEPMADGFALKELLRERKKFFGFIRPDDSTSVRGHSQIVHMAHYWIVKHRQTVFEVDADFERTAAHEFGHRIMGAYGGRGYSWTHNQSSTELTQKPLTGTAHPPSGEIDLMKYAEYETDVRDKWQRSVASEQDVKGLLWLTRVKFN